MPTEALKKNEVDKDYANSWFALTPNRLLATLGPLKGEINCDVCVIGGGFTGLSAALELAKKGYSVTLLEARTMPESACGRNGSHIVRGYVPSPEKLLRKYDLSTVRLLCNLTLEGLALVIERIAKYDIKCDLKFGHVTTALQPHHIFQLKRSMKDWEKIGHRDLSYIGKKDIGGYVQSARYSGGLLDPKGAHFHPLNYALGIAQAAQAHACKIYDETPVISIEKGETAKVITAQGAVAAKFIVMGGHVDVRGIERLNKKVVRTSISMIATEPLGEGRSQQLLPKNSAITEAGPEMNYFRLSADNRLLFSGDCGKAARDPLAAGDALKRKMTNVFPTLGNVEVAHCWSSPMDVTLNRLPDFGRLGNIFYAHGYCGHSIILGNLAGKLIAEAMSGTAERFDVFAKIRHTSFLGIDLIKRPVFSFGRAWNRMQEYLG